jgi:hypothetical protein
MGRAIKSVVGQKQAAFSNRDFWIGRANPARSRVKRQGPKHTVLVHGFYSNREVAVLTNILWIESLAATLTNDDRLRSETAESVVQSVFTHVGSIAGGDFWDEESTFAPIKTNMTR